jgi:hypothetical protein
MKNFDNLNQNEDSSGNQWELSPEELAEIQHNSRLDLEKRTKQFKQSDHYKRALENFDKKNFWKHNNINRADTEPSFAVRNRLQYYYLDNMYSIFAAENEYANMLKEREEIGERRREAIAIAMHRKESLQYKDRSNIKKLFDRVKHGFSEKRAKESYFKGSSDFIKANKIEFKDADGNIEDIDRLYLIGVPDEKKYTEDLVNDYMSRLAEHEEGTELKKEQYANKIKAEKHSAMLSGYQETSNKPAPSEGYIVNSTAIAKSIRRNEKKKQKQK